MNLDELRTVQSKERSKDSLQHLRESFYAEVGEYIEDLKDQRERAAERAESQFDDPEVNRLTDEIHTAEDVVEAIYERRVGKVVKRASLAAAGMPADDDGLTSEEQELFAELVEKIEANKEEVLDVLAGEVSGSTATTTDSTPDASPDPVSESAPADDVSAADVMGGGRGDAAPAATASAEAGSGPDASPGSDPATAADSDDPRPGPEEAAAVAGGDGDPDPEQSADREPGEESEPDDPTAGLDERTTIRITRDVGEIFGVDERTYDLASEDVVTLPEENAGPLVERGAAEKLE
ncbi:hypothetical protein NGM10_13585 [Halorussus salilacus]|uniref:hypothetical protein n=1 Tax=Halorussus salilacus TaxID=2953750 RepID=UPI00209FE37B|nr:hypothetical protein [Halorussus salilacus]USZ67754.1 hypothetical protein NGM10_13585 [Halorussus salilacus]